MDLPQVEAILKKYGWTPHLQTHGKGGRYLYAAQWSPNTRKTHFRYIAPVHRVNELTEQDIVDKLQRKPKPPNPYKIYA